MANYYVYLYHRQKNQKVNGIYSLVWMVSPYRLSPNSYIVFSWSLTYSLIWLETGILKPGSTPRFGGFVNIDPIYVNCAVFDIQSNAPSFSKFKILDQKNMLFVNGGIRIPNLAFSTGFGISGSAAFVSQSLMNAQQKFNLETDCLVAASTNIRTGEVLAQKDSETSTKSLFPPNVWCLEATLTDNNQWYVLPVGFCY